MISPFSFLREVRIDTFRAGFNPPYLRATHMPTGLTVEGRVTKEESQSRLLRRLINELRSMANPP